MYVCAESNWSQHRTRALLSLTLAMLSTALWSESSKIDELKVAAQSVYCQHDAFGIEIEGSPRTFHVFGGKADVEDGSDGAAELMLLQIGGEAIEAVAEKSQGVGVVGNAVPVSVDQDRGLGEFAQDVASEASDAGDKGEGGTVFK